jgi:DNA polymerase I-like protein with 3'-5' exonuclease and polymerase domains
MKRIFACDLEADGFLDELTKMHNFGAIDLITGEEFLWESRPTGQGRPLSELQGWLDEGHTLAIHNGVLFDGEALIKLGYCISSNDFIDTLPLSWILSPDRKRHGLEWYGEDYDIPKPPVYDWVNGEQTEYNRRVLQDCRIQRRLTTEQLYQLKLLYSHDEVKMHKYIDYIMMKMEHLRCQQRTRWKFDQEGAQKLLYELESHRDSKLIELAGVMPKVPVMAVKKRPAKPYKKSGELSSTGLKWHDLCNEYGWEFDTEESYKIKVAESEPNPGSSIQVKAWLKSLGWVCETFKYIRDKKTGDVRKVEQVSVASSGGKIDPDIYRLIEEYPELQALEGLGLLKHRVSLVQGMVNNGGDGYLTARAGGITNTLRLKHSELVNLPSSRVPWGKEIRALLIVDEGYELLGSDLSSLEDRVKHHYQWKYDPEYVKEQMHDDYDPHLYIAEAGFLLTASQVEKHKSGEEDHSRERSIAKNGNYACQYGAGIETLARTAKVSEEVAKVVHTAYHKVNWSIKQIAKDIRKTNVKTVNKKMWLRNPINGFWYWIKEEKDIFSTLCQGSGSYVFDMWVENIRQIFYREASGLREFPLCGQFHDELIVRVPSNNASKERWDNIVQQAIGKFNEDFELNREMAADCQFGVDYSKIH